MGHLLCNPDDGWPVSHISFCLGLVGKLYHIFFFFSQSKCLRPLILRHIINRGIKNTVRTASNVIHHKNLFVRAVWWWYFTDISGVSDFISSLQFRLSLQKAHDHFSASFWSCERSVIYPLEINTFLVYNTLLSCNWKMEEWKIKDKLL